MNTFIRFFYEFISVFLNGLGMIFKGLVGGIKKMFSISDYAKVIDSYNGSFNGLEKFFVFLSVAFLVLIVLLIVFLIVL